ncbi:hypothetical protein G6F40_016859 [Rhizopus arrhizus]|nr:hypothetical protein G6F40_016859 [Rhizopus arrhizus]
MVIMIGRRRSREPSTSAWVRPMPPRRRLLMCSIITMPLFTTTPISTRMPMKDMIPNEVPVIQNSQNTPKIENSTPLMIAAGNSSDSNTAAITT